jgi:hypothetical protein
MIINDEVYLEHYGVKGMHWGIRNDREPMTTKTKIKIGASFVGAAVAAGTLYKVISKGKIHSQPFKAPDSDWDMMNRAIRDLYRTGDLTDGVGEGTDSFGRPLHSLKDTLDLFDKY